MWVIGKCFVFIYVAKMNAENSAVGQDTDMGS